MMTPHSRPPWNVPSRRNPFFTGREDVLSQLYQALRAENAVALSHPQGISGLGGIGKTQTALEYAYRYRTEYDAVFWVRAASAISLISGFVELAQLLGLPERDEKDQNIIVEAVLRWFRTNTRWLLVLDNIDDLSVVEPFLPKAGPGHILLTTRAQALSGIAQRLEVQKMEPEVGALLLLRRAGILPLQATLSTAFEDDRKVAYKISQELDGLPLALDQAGAYIKEIPCSLMDYVALYQTRRGEILQVRGSFGRDYPASVATTWSLSFEKISKASAAATELLDFCAFMAPDAIPEEAITAGLQHLTPSLQVVAAHPLQFDQTIAILLAYSLIERNANATLSIHRLVQAVLQDTLEETQRRSWAERAMLAVDAAFPHAEFDVWPQCERLLPHALLAIYYIETDHIMAKEAGRLLHETAMYLHNRGRFSEAEPLYQQAVRIREQLLGPEHPDVARSLNNLGVLYYRQGLHGQAEPIYEKALAIHERVLGPEHIDVAKTLHNLALIYEEQGKYTQAESSYLRSLEIRKKVLGEHHPLFARTLNNLAWLYHLQGRHAQAEPLSKRVVTIIEQAYGSEHPDVAHSLNTLAEIYRVQGKYGQAEQLFQRALEMREKIFGPIHPDVATTLSDLATLYEDQGKHQEAEPLMKRALTIGEQLLGPEHPEVAYPLHGLANLYREQGKYAEAEALYQRALNIRTQHSGSQRPETAEVMYDLALLQEAQGNRDKAKPLYEHALAIREHVLGPEHPKTKETRKHYITLLREMGQYDEAASLEATLSEPTKTEEEQEQHPEE